MLINYFPILIFGAIVLLMGTFLVALGLILGKVMGHARPDKEKQYISNMVMWACAPTDISRPRMQGRKHTGHKHVMPIQRVVIDGEKATVSLIRIPKSTPKPPKCQTQKIVQLQKTHGLHTDHLDKSTRMVSQGHKARVTR